MTYEHDIPEYAMLPAREPKERVIVPAGKGTVYSQVQVTNIKEKPKTTIIIEEDILVPDTKPDLRQILMIDGSASLSSRELSPMQRKDDYISISGEIELQTLYQPENPEHAGQVIAVQTRVAFQEQWHMEVEPASTIFMDCQVEKIEHMVINERKYRIKAVLALRAREHSDVQIEVFEGITGEDIQMLKETVEIANLSQRKKDVFSIDEEIEVKDEKIPENILKQDIHVVENYKQITNEKIVLNGFIYVNLLYTVQAQEEERMADTIRQQQEKVEFTQFIPIQMDQLAGGSEITFDGSGLKVRIGAGEDEELKLRLEGEIITYVDLYTNNRQEIVLDAYHKEKDFICDYQEKEGRMLVGAAMSETSVREILVPENLSCDIDRILYVCGSAGEYESHAEPGKIITEGYILVKMLYVGCKKEQDAEGKACEEIFCAVSNVPFRIVTAMPQLTGNEIVCDKVEIKELWADKINGRQIECNVTVLVISDVMRPVPFKLLSNPAFEESGEKKQECGIVIYVTKENDSIWSIAKHFKTDRETVMQMNDLDHESQGIRTGTKLLIMK